MKFEGRERFALVGLAGLLSLAYLHHEVGQESTYYDILHCSPSSSPRDIQRAYRKLATKYHPDKLGANEGDSKMSEYFSQVQEAYMILKDPEKRATYDFQLGGVSSELPFLPNMGTQAPWGSGIMQMIAGVAVLGVLNYAKQYLSDYMLGPL